jgi:uncharacterized membrane protein
MQFFAVIVIKLNKRSDIMKNFFGWAIYVLGALICLYLHVWTVLWVYSLFGGTWAVSAFFAPPVSELMLAFSTIKINGLFNQYIISWVIAIIISYSGKVIISSVAEGEKNVG